MKACVDRTGTLMGLEKTLEEAIDRPETRGILLLTCDKNSYDPRDIGAALGRLRVPVVGALFPSVFDGIDLLERGTVAVSLPAAPEIFAFGGDDSDEEELRNSLIKSGLEPHSTMLVFVDGLALNAGAVLDAIFDVFGLETSYLGGGAGSLTLRRRPCLLTNDGMRQGGAVIAAIDLKCGIGVAHGHRKVEGPHQITSASGHVVRSIDWRPAATCFKELVGPHLLPGDDDSGGVVSRNFCLALNRMDGDFVVREAVRVRDDNSLEFPTRMQEHELVDIVKADREEMLKAPAAAKKEAERNLGGRPGTNLFFTCCARQMFLGPDFAKEIEGLKRGAGPVFGAVTVGGEIANNGDSYLDYYNRTCVVGAFEV